MNDAIIIENIHKSYGQVKALNGVSITVRPGRVFGLLGPNGAGKTTLVRILTTLLRPDSGSAIVAGVDVLKNPAQARQIIGLAGQYPAVDEQLTGLENLIMVGQLYHFSYQHSKKRATELLERFRLTEAAKRPLKTYSGGMRRRLDLAASIVARPQVLFLDEPTTGLDPRTRQETWGLIRELVSEGTTLLLTTQYLEEADALANFIAVIDNGEVIAEGTSNELKARLASDVLELRIISQEDLDKARQILAPIGKEAPSINPESGWLTLPVDQGTKSLLEVVRILDTQNVPVEDVTLRRPSLDDVFLTLTGKTTANQAN